MANSQLTSSFIIRKAMDVAHSRSHIVRNVDHSYGELFGKSIDPVGKGGPSISIRKPVLGSVGRTWAIQAPDYAHTTVQLTMDQVFNVAMPFQDSDLYLSEEDFAKRYIEPNILMLISQIEAYVSNYMAQNAGHAVTNVADNYTSITTPGATSAAEGMGVFMTAKQLLNDSLVPEGSPIRAVISPLTERYMVPALSGQYNPQPVISGMWERGEMPNSTAMGMEWYMSQTLPTITCGSRTNSTPVGNVLTPGTATGATLTPNTLSYTAGTGGGTGTHVVSDVFEIEGINDVNFETKADTGNRKQFIITAASSSSGGAGTLTFNPPIVSSGPYQNVSGIAVSGKHIYFYGTASTAYKQDLIFAEKSTAFAMADLEIPNGMDMAEKITMDGLSFRFLRGYDIYNARRISRIDAFCGCAMLRPEWCCKTYAKKA